jgi:hypothetical protein
VPIGIGIVLLSSGRLRAFLPPEPGVFFVFAAVCLLLTFLAVRLFVDAMPAKTAKGARLARYCLGFQEFVIRVEKDRLERMAKEDPTLFERVLPYAVVLGCADEWAERFEGLLTEPPSWYRSSSFTPGRLPFSRFRPRPKHAVHGLDADVATAPERGRFSWNQRRRRPRLERLRSERRRKRRRFRWRRRRELVRAQDQG